MRHARVRLAAILLALALGASCSDDDGAPAAEARTAAPTTPAAGTSADDVDDRGATTSQVQIEPSTTPAAAPAEFTACVNPGPEVHRGTEERSQVSLPDGEMTITRGRGYTWRSTVRDVSDPRLDGTWYISNAGDTYTGGVPNLPFGMYATTHRIENDEGAWQGSHVVIDFADGESVDGPIVLLGEGAYDGLTAVGIIGFGEAPCPNTRGHIIEGTVPAPPVPDTGQ
jgi:hypothetical protein